MKFFLGPLGTPVTVHRWTHPGEICKTAGLVIALMITIPVISDDSRSEVPAHSLTSGHSVISDKSGLA